MKLDIDFAIRIMEAIEKSEKSVDVGLSYITG